MKSTSTCKVCKKEWVHPGVCLYVEDSCKCDLRAQRDAALDRITELDGRPQIRDGEPPLRARRLPRTRRLREEHDRRRGADARWGATETARAPSRESARSRAND